MENWERGLGKSAHVSFELVVEEKSASQRLSWKFKFDTLKRGSTFAVVFNITRSRMNSAGLFFSLNVFFLCNWPTESHVKLHLTHNNIRSVESPDPDSFLDGLFQKYGANGSMDVNQFKELLKEVRSGDKDSSSVKNKKISENGNLRVSGRHAL